MPVELLSGVLAASVVLSLVVFYLLGRNRSSSPSVPSQVQSILSSAYLARSRGDLAQATMLYESACSQLQGMSRADESVLCTCFENLAECYERSGDWRRARELRSQMVEIWESALKSGREDFLTDIDYLCTHADFGVSTREIADFYEKILALRERKLVPHSTEFINTVSIYARLMRTLGETQVADDLESHAAKLRRGGSSKLELQSNSGNLDAQYPASGGAAGTTCGESSAGPLESGDYLESNQSDSSG